MEKKHFEVIIIGAGVMGSATAYYLSKHCGEDVLLLEQFDLLHRRGSSHGDSRIIRKTYPQEHYTELMIDAYALWEAAESEAETKVFTKTGGLDMSYIDNEQIKQLIRSAEKYNVPAEVLTPSQVKAKFPSITIPDDNIGVYCPDSGILNATKAVAMFHYLAKLNGCRIKDNTFVTDIYQEKRGTKFETIVKANNGQTFTCAKCIVTVGPWAKKFLNKLNVDLPLRAVQTTVAYWRVDNPSLYSSTVFPVFINYSDESLVYGFPAHEFPNLIKCCAHFGPDIDPDIRDFLPGVADLQKTVAPFLKKTFQGVEPVTEKTESCVYTWTPDEDFIIDEVPGHEGIFIGCGFSGHGFKLAPIVGKIFSELVLSKPHPYPKTRNIFSIDRFKRKCKI
ncbi:putative sarcosine oxidase [Pseudolycoriella hygida]|uniref:sarcosine oxidasee (formaldehyde-forming) n=1 Tax=Pseudolycoriella hygida TaxID=35572 RepID=A0A9Q0N5J5_9DIPT|nr:putative sarcosine oxidase [Pseudolycoriella hygida]